MTFVEAAAAWAAPPPGVPKAPAAPAAASPAAPAARPADPATEAKRSRAVALFREGNRALDGGDYRGALTRFQKAYELFPSPKLLFNMAQAYNELGRLVEAVEAYERFVKEFRKADNPQLFQLAHKRIFGLQGQIASIRLETNVVGASVTVDGAPLGETPITRSLRFLPGPHAIVVAKAGYDRRVVQKTLPAGTTVLRIELLTEAEAIAKREEVRRLTEARRRAEERLRRAQELNRSRQAQRQRRFRVAGWAVFGTGLALMATGTGFGINNLVKNSHLVGHADGTSWAEASADYQASRDSRIVFWVGMGVGAAVVATGAVMLYLQSRMGRSEEPAQPATNSSPSAAVLKSLRVLPGASPGGVGASLSLEF